jgi:hypothetical protein
MTAISPRPIQLTTDTGGDELTLRNASLRQLVSVLEGQHTRKFDVVTPASRLRAEAGQLLVVGGGEKTLTPDGVSDTDVTLRPTSSAIGDMADKLAIPVKYLRRLREHGKTDLFDHNVNTWLDELGDYKLFTRALVAPGAQVGIARALLTSSYRIIDNLDVLHTVLAGVQKAGVQVEITQCDLSETRMYAKIACPEISEYAPQLLGNYTSPFTGARGAENPLVYAGFVIANSETGAGRATITPQLTVEICKNGLTMTEDALKATHLGGRMEQGVIRWSDDTRRTEIELIAKQARDAVTTFLDRDYVHSKLDKLTREATVEITAPQVTLEHVAGQLKFSKTERERVFSQFIRGGDTTSGGVMHAVTAAAQLIANPDQAYEMEAQGPRAMSLAAAHASKYR